MTLNAEKLLLLTNIPGVLDKAGSCSTKLTSARIDELLRRWHDLRRHAAQDCRARSTRRQGRRATRCTSSMAGCRTPCCWKF